MSYEAIQLGRLGIRCQARSRRWEIRPKRVGGILYAEVCNLSSPAGGQQRVSASWAVEADEDVGVLHLDAPIGSGRSPTDMEVRQLISIDAAYRYASKAWALKPVDKGGLLDHLEVISGVAKTPKVVGRLFFREPGQASVARPWRASSCAGALPEAGRRVLDLLF